MLKKMFLRFRILPMSVVPSNFPMNHLCRFINYADLKCSTQTALLSIPGYYSYPGSSEGTYLMIRNTEIWVQTSALALSHQTKWNLIAYSLQLGHHHFRKELIMENNIHCRKQIIYKQKNKNYIPTNQRSPFQI